MIYTRMHVRMYQFNTLTLTPLGFKFISLCICDNIMKSTIIRYLCTYFQHIFRIHCFYNRLPSIMAITLQMPRTIDSCNPYARIPFIGTQRHCTQCSLCYRFRALFTHSLSLSHAGAHTSSRNDLQESEQEGERERERVVLIQSKQTIERHIEMRMRYQAE